MMDTAGKVLVVDDEKNMRESLAEFLALDGFACELAASGEDALSLLSRSTFDAAVLDLWLPGMSGIDVLGKIRETGPSLPVIMMSAHGEIRDAVAAMKLGATDYLVKPFDPAELAFRLAKAISDSRLIRLARVGERLDARLNAERDTSSGGSWLGDDPVMSGIINLVHRVAPTDSTVLVTGESGTGKEIIAREIHRQSTRSAGPFVPVNVGAIPETLLESELFGYEKGSFTGAENRKLGLFELASGGTLFLDELGEMPLSMQVKLLRVLQDRTIMRVGGTRPIPVDVRIVAATNRDLEALVRNGTFREDLYFRVNVIRLKLPALRDRPLDIAPLAGMFTARFSREMRKPVSGLSPEALSMLSAYGFPGNIRELENLIERAVILCEGDVLEPRDFMIDRLALEEDSLRPDSRAAANPAASAFTASAASPAASPVSVRDAEKQAIVAALVRNAWHRERTSAELGISRRTLLTKMKEYGLSEP
jgi:two-component system response regulator AtoC